jgi:hypothetical protein
MSNKIRELLSQKQSKLNLREGSSSAHFCDKYQDGGYYIIPLAAITPNPHQPRKYFDPKALAELTQSIREKGVLQPVIVRVDKEEKFHLVNVTK